MTDHSLTADHWPAPLASGAVEATVTVPGSKSVTNRALILASLAADPSWVRRPLRSRDTLLMAEALRRLGVSDEDIVATMLETRRRDVERFEVDLVGGVYARGHLLLSNVPGRTAP